MSTNRLPFAVLTLTAAISAGCSGQPALDDRVDHFSSDQATLLVLEFDGEYIADIVSNAERKAEDQLLYTIGQLNEHRSVGRLDKLTLTDVQRTELEDGKTRVSYHATLPVAWGSKTNLPSSYELILPHQVDYNDYQSFTEKYSHTCVDWSAHDVDSGSMWYYFRPERSGCELADEDVFKTTATVTVSDENTTGKYPEYHKVWEDDALSVVAIFGKYEDGATTSSDAGIRAYNEFVKEISTQLGEHQLTTEPTELPSAPGVAHPDTTFRATLADGNKVEVVALLVDNVRTAGATFNERYEQLSGDADMIFYNGHAGLGANVRALAQKGKFKAGKYQIFFMNGCDTYAYVDDQLALTKAELNPDDPTGTRYLDMVTNAMPSYFRSMPHASMAMIRGLLSYDEPKTYDEIFSKIDSSEVVLVTGEEDNVYVPGYDPQAASGTWEGLVETGTVSSGESMSFETDTLSAGSYVFTTAEDDDSPGGDVDLYVAVGRAPTLSDYDFRPYLDGSAESVTVRLDAPAKIYLLVHAYEGANAETSSFVLTGAVAD